MAVSHVSNTVLKSEGNILAGSLYICFSGTMFAIAGMSVKSALVELDPFILVFWRNLLSCLLIILGIMFSRSATVKDLRTDNLRQHALRSLFSMIVLYSYFYTVNTLNLGIAVLFLSMGPIFIPVLALIFYRRMSDRALWIGLCVAFLGVTLITQPGGVTLSYGLLFVLISGLFGGASTLTIWSMSNTESPIRQLFYFSILSLLLSLPLAMLHWKLPTANTFTPIVILGISTTLAQYFLSRGFSLAPAEKIYAWNYLSIVISSVGAYLGWGEKLSALTVVGMTFVVIGARIATLKYKR